RGTAADFGDDESGDHGKKSEVEETGGGFGGFGSGEHGGDGVQGVTAVGHHGPGVMLDVEGPAGLAEDGEREGEVHGESVGADFGFEGDEEVGGEEEEEEGEGGGLGAGDRKTPERGQEAPRRPGPEGTPLPHC